MLQAYVAERVDVNRAAFVERCRLRQVGKSAVPDVFAHGSVSPYVKRVYMNPIETGLGPLGTILHVQLNSWRHFLQGGVQVFVLLVLLMSLLFVSR